MDVQAEDVLIDEIRRAAEEVEGVAAVEKLWVRKTGLEYLADIHVEVDAQMTVEDGHRIAHLVKDKLLSHFAPLRDVLVHLEPSPNGHRAVTQRAGATGDGVVPVPRAIKTGALRRCLHEWGVTLNDGDTPRTDTPLLSLHYSTNIHKTPRGVPAGERLA